MTRPDAIAMSRAPQPETLAVPATLLALSLLWFYWPTLGAMHRRWATDPHYAHGYLVPGFALTLLWFRRDRRNRVPGGPYWSGLLLIGLALAMRLGGAYVYVGWVEGVSLIPAVAGFSVLIGGWCVLRWTWSATAFLIFMIPLPYRVEGALAGPLQQVATRCSTYALQLLGLPALAVGTAIHLGEVELNVVEACSGLSMLFTFFAMTTGLVLVTPRPWFETIVIVASAAPIALIANMTRITLTGVLHVTAGTRWANLVFHDLAGWFMMPLALGLLRLELILLNRLCLAPSEASQTSDNPRCGPTSRSSEHDKGSAGESDPGASPSVLRLPS